MKETISTSNEEECRKRRRRYKIEQRAYFIFLGWGIYYYNEQFISTLKPVFLLLKEKIKFFLPW